MALPACSLWRARRCSGSTTTSSRAPPRPRQPGEPRAARALPEPRRSPPGGAGRAHRAGSRASRRAVAAFVEAYDGTPPTAGYGAHEKSPASGWQTTWPHPTKVDLAAEIECDTLWQTWTAQPGANELLPINCVSWYAAFLFCAWDGGRLPTEAEWNLAAAGGVEQRQYPWGNSSPARELLVYTPCMTCATPPIAQVGSKPAGAGRWGQLDLSGNVAEWTLDYSHMETDGPCVLLSPCQDCIELDGDGIVVRIRRGGSYASDYEFGASVRRDRLMDLSSPEQGIRCARAAP